MNDAPRQATRLDAIGGRFDPWLLGAMLALASLGVVMVASASIYQHGNPFYYLIRHGMFLVAGAGLAWWLTRTELKSIEARNQVLLLGCVVLLLLVFVPGLGVSVKGAHRWINLGVSNFQVVEVVKVFFIVWLASYLVRFRDDVSATWKAMLKPFGVALTLVALLLLQPDFGSSTLLLAITAGMLVLGGVNILRIVLPGIGLVMMLAMLAVAAPYRLRRITSFTNPWDDPFGSGYQLTNALMAIGRGEWSGIGLGGSVLKLNYLPEVHTDFIFSVIGEELGFVGVCLVIALYALLVGRAFVIGLRCVEMRRHFAGYVAFGVALWIGMQSFVSMGVNLGLLPTKGLTLPLISSGGSSILMTCVAMGLLLRVSYELERTQRQVALRGDAAQGAGEAPRAPAEPRPASPAPAPATAAGVSLSQTLRGTSRLHARVEPTFERLA
ncbi:putative lipid II flippase FtsW [uncultured Pseudoxanthomonas sp.]|uniref:putative lipid II flippase FtsW n=1 Tax=uncultured Pseudoxanthomonas sp. TaxID=281701 RepID=UPI00261D8358|nr:putative lipid II flippase FtsW [uncultured Pseudoxanthomonas sp.]